MTDIEKQELNDETALDDNPVTQPVESSLGEDISGTGEEQVMVGEDVDAETADTQNMPTEPESQTSQSAPSNGNVIYRWNYDAQVNVDAQRTKKENRRGAWVYAGVVTAMFAVCLGILVVLLAMGGGKITSSNIPVADGVAVAEKVNPSIVSIKSNISGGYSTGTGVIWSPNGDIVTNYHVVEGAYSITVMDLYGNEYSAKLVGASPENDTALIHVNAKNMTPAIFTDSSTVKQGEVVFALGNPGGLTFAWSITQGIVSSTSRNVITESGYSINVIQMDASVNHGNSGGALVNANGDVIGIVCMKMGDDYEGIGFALPSNDVVKIIAEIKAGTVDKVDEVDIVNRPYLGITGVGVVEGQNYRLQGTQVIPVPDELTYLYECFHADATGVWVIETSSQGSAHLILEKNDIILTVESQTVTDIQDVIGLLSKHRVGDMVDITYYRDGEILSAKIKLISNPDS